MDPPLGLTGMLALVLEAALLAMLIPALRAAAVDPMTSLRSD